MKIRTIKLNRAYKYLWLKYVKGFDLNNHCAKCLVGNYSEKISPQINNHKTVEGVVLDEYDYKYIYICGVTSPYVWKDNLHLALEDCKGSVVEYKFDDGVIIVEDAKQIPIYRQTVYNHPKGIYASYNTCRNWRFAYQQSIKDN